MATSQYTYHPYHTIGAATMLLWDSAAGDSGAWRHLGKVADAAILMNTEQVGKDIVTKGLAQPIARRNRSKRYSLSFRLLEDTNPLALAMMGGEGAAQISSGSELATTSEVVRLFGTDWRELAHPYGIASEQPGAATNVNASAGGTGGTITPGTYYYWIVPMAGGIQGTAAPTGSVTVSSGEKVTITFDPPTGWNPDDYMVVFSTGDSIGGASIAGSGYTGSGIVLSSHDGGAFSVSSDMLSVASYDGLTTYTVDTDYSVDIEKGLVKRIADGAIADGEQVVVIYAYWRPASVSTALGDAVDLEHYRKLRLLQLKPDDPDPANWRETGVEFTFFKVNIGMGDSRWPFSENDFSEGISFTWDAMFDGTEGKVGTARSTYGVLAEYE